MKKLAFLLALMSTLLAKAQTTKTTIIEPQSTESSVNCWAQPNAFWNGNDCCVVIHCTITGSNGMQTGGFSFNNCITYYVERVFPPTPTFYPLPNSIGLIDDHQPTIDEINYVNEFKRSGKYTLSNDSRTIDSDGNITIMKAGTYSIKNNYVQTLISTVKN